MPPLLREHPDELAALIAAAATQLGLRARHFSPAH
ncbi:hypothetical protein ABIA39_007747 [Nocardia sp. GAS34]